MAENTEQRPWFFNLNKDGDEAVVRILHSSPKTIESFDTHSIEVAGKKKRIRCNGDGCPLCNNGNLINHRIYVHLWDYTDNKEKVWDRTDRILEQFEELFTSWNPLYTAVVKIKRIGNEFPKYDVVVQNPMNYAEVDKALVDKPIANRFSLKRSNEDIQEFMNKGVFPERKAYVPKEEYFKQKQTEKAQTESEQPKVESQQDVVQSKLEPINSQPVDTFDPFADDTFIIKPRKV